jgi:hypothetical protein
VAIGRSATAHNLTLNSFGTTALAVRKRAHSVDRDLRAHASENAAIAEVGKMVKTRIAKSSRTSR